MLPADLSLKAAGEIAHWYEEHKDDAKEGLPNGNPSGQPAAQWPSTSAFY